MAKYLTLVNGIPDNADTIDTFTGNPDELVSTDANGFIDSTLINPALTGGVSIVVGEPGGMVAGDLAAITVNAGVANLFKSDKTNPLLHTVGFVDATVAQGASAALKFSGVIPLNVAGAVVGSDIFMDINGLGSATPASVAGETSQKVGEYLGDGVGFIFERVTRVTI